MGDLIDICIAFAAQRVDPSDAPFAARGYTKGSLLGAPLYTLPVGEGTLARINGSSVKMVFSRGLGRCNLALTGVSTGVQLVGGWVREQIESAGYTEVPTDNRRRFSYRKGALEFDLTGSQVGGQTVISLLRKR